jgi:tetratricopeptide (TPR) repeat protein
MPSQKDINASLNIHNDYRLFLSSSSFLKRCKRYTILLVLVLCLNSSSLHGQILRDSTSINLIKKGIDYVYNFQFSNAEKISSELKKLYPGHPLTYLFKGMITYWENYPLTTTSEARESFEEDMRKCIELCDKNKNPSTDAEILLVNLCARGLLLLFYTENDLSFEVFPIAASTYQCIRRSFDYTANYSDFYFFTGVYNYYREAYPEAHPVYKTLAFLFPNGSKVKGLEDLKTVARSSILLKAESYSFLTQIFLSFESNFQQATFYSKSLHSIYPDNPEYLGTYIKNLLLIKQYDEAEKNIISSNAYLNNSYFRAQITIFKGILQEKKYHDFNQAQQYYMKGIKDISVFRSYGNEYAAYAYFGLSRISGMGGDKDNEKTYQKLALKLADFRNNDFNDSSH